MNIFIRGEINVGKTTLINKIKEKHCNDIDFVDLFITKKIKNEVFIIEGSTKIKVLNDKNVIITNSFNTYANRHLLSVKSKYNIIDELGFLELNENDFKLAITTILSNENYINIIAIKSKMNKFLEKLINIPDSYVFDLKKDNSDLIFNEIDVLISEHNLKSYK